MRVVLASVSFLSSTVAGYILAARVSSGYKDIQILHGSLSSLSQLITVYNEGFTKAIVSSGADRNCELFSEILTLASLGRNDIYSEAVKNTAYPDEIKQSLSFLFSKIMGGDCGSIKEAFDNVIKTVADVEKDLKDKKEKNAPLYRKAGILTGLATAILLL